VEGNEDCGRFCEGKRSDHVDEVDVSSLPPPTSEGKEEEDEEDEEERECVGTKGGWVEGTTEGKVRKDD
jgi:hypothetical protein